MAEQMTEQYGYSPCPIRSIARATRDTDNAVLVEVKRVYPREWFSAGKRMVLLLRNSELDFGPEPWCDVVQATATNLKAIRDTIGQLQRRLPIAARRGNSGTP